MKKILNNIVILIHFLCLKTVFLINSEKNSNNQRHLISKRNVVNDSFSELLYSNLLSNYNKKLKPPGLVQITFALNIEKVVELIAKEEVLVMNAWINHEWIDSRLSWNPDDYGNITSIQIFSDLVWTPDTFLDTSAERSSLMLPDKGSFFDLKHTGYLFWPLSMKGLRTRCPMDVSRFPYDVQNCKLYFSSWTYTIKSLNYTLNDNDENLANYVESSAWHLVEFRQYRKETIYENWGDEAFAEMHYIIALRRKPLYLITNCVLPAIILSSLTLVSFYLPFAQQIQIGISIILSFSVLTIKYSNDIPVQSDSVPLLSIYFLICMVYTLFGMVWFTITHQIIEKKRIPKFISYMTIYAVSIIYYKKHKVLQLKRKFTKFYSIDKCNKDFHNSKLDFNNSQTNIAINDNKETSGESDNVSLGLKVRLSINKISAINEFSNYSETCKTIATDNKIQTGKEYNGNDFKIKIEEISDQEFFDISLSLLNKAIFVIFTLALMLINLILNVILPLS